MTRFFLFLLPLSFLIPFSSLGQVEETKKKQSREAVPEVVLGKNRIIYQNRIYRLNAPYVTFAYGAGHGFESDKIEQNMTLAFHYFIKGFGLRLGYHSSSDTKIWWRSYQKLNDLFLGFGTRLEKPRWNFAIFGGQERIAFVDGALQQAAGAGLLASEGETGQTAWLSFGLLGS